MPERSDRVAWRGRGATGHTRLTYRFATRLHHLQSEAAAGGFRALFERPDPPDVFVLETGAWDQAIGATDAHRMAEMLEDVLSRLAAAAAAAARAGRGVEPPRLAVATLSVPAMRARNASCYDARTWERLAVERANAAAAGGVPRVHLLDRTSLMDAMARGGVGCRDASVACVRRGLHPPHLTNVFDVLRLASLLPRSDADAVGAAAVGAAGGARGSERRVEVRLATEWRSSCCCSPPPAAEMATRGGRGDVHLARRCLLE